MATTTRVRGRGWAVGLLALPLLLAACGTQHAGSGSGSGSDLPLLHVGSRSGTAAMDMGGASGADADYPLVGTLPTGPTSAVVYRFPSGATSADTVTKLAAALQLGADPVRHAHGWEVTRSGDVLRVRDDGTWSYWSADAWCPEQVDVDSADGATTAIGCAAPLPVPKSAVTDAQALAAATPVLQASGATGSPSVNRADLVRVSASRSVDGLLVVGRDTTVTVGASGVIDASGTAGTPDAGPAYPIITAAQALDLLRAAPKPAIACAVGATCPGVGPEHVTGATLGLVLSSDGSTPVLLPAWLFTVQEESTPLAVMAVQDQYLADPTPGPVASASSVPGSSGAGSPGSSGGGSAVTSPEPVPPASDLPLPTPATTVPVSHSVSIDRATVSADGRTLTLWGEGGACETYTAEAKEDADHVYAVLSATWTKKGVACPAIVKAVSATVTLASPLGTRTVLDAGLSSLPTVPVA